MMANLHIVCWALLLVWTWQVECDEGKRLILHGDADVVAAIQNLTAEVAQLKSSVSTLQSTVTQLQTSGTGGGTYVRWGRNTCPSDNERVYKGYVGGSEYTQGGANTICLTDEPQWGHFEESVTSGASVYGTEYEMPVRSSQYFGQNINEEDAVCAVCRSPRPSVVMIPGRQDCYPGWTKEYSGYLVSEATAHAASEYNCLDMRPEMVPGGIEDKNGHLFYLVDAICGSLTCPPYFNSRELTCVVCSK